MKVASFALFAASVLPAALASVTPGQLLPALLRAGSRDVVGRELVGRQAGTCEAGSLPCSDGLGCCPVGQYCGTWSGKPGCCPIGKSCVANDNPCIYKGDLPCAGETFCCPAGDTCFRDATGAPKCALSGGGNTNTIGGGNTNTLGGNTNTFANTPSATFVSTPVATALPSNTKVSGGGVTTIPAAVTTTASGGGSGLTNPFSSNGAISAGASGFALVAAGVAANILLAAH